MMRMSISSHLYCHNLQRGLTALLRSISVTPELWPKPDFCSLLPLTSLPPVWVQCLPDFSPTFLQWDHYYFSLQPESREHIVAFNMLNYRSCKNLWKSCVEHHTFFQAKKLLPQEKNVLSQYWTLGSRNPKKWVCFRECGHTNWDVTVSWSPLVNGPLWQRMGPSFWCLKPWLSPPRSNHVSFCSAPGASHISALVSVPSMLLCLEFPGKQNHSYPHALSREGLCVSLLPAWRLPSLMPVNWPPLQNINQPSTEAEWAEIKVSQVKWLWDGLPIRIRKQGLGI